MELTPFQFRESDHSYWVDGVQWPSITQMISAVGLVNAEWYTEESCDRGHDVHALTAAYDLGALDVASCVSPFRGYLLAHVKAMQILRPRIFAVEEPLVHRLYRFGGRPDRIVKLDGALGVLEVKSGARHPAQPIQTMLQAMLVEQVIGLAPEMQLRWCLFLKPDGRFKVEQHKDTAHDLREARKVLAQCAG